MEKEQLEFLIKENSELKEQINILNLKVRSESINNVIEDLIDEDYSTEVEWNCPLSFVVTFNYKDENNLYFDVESTNDYINFHIDSIEISFDDIIENIDNKPINEITISESIDELINNRITEW